MMSSTSGILPVNVAVIGCISHGKTTVVNAIHGYPVAATNLRRNTTVPHVYIKSKEHKCDTVETIYQRSEEANQIASKKLEEGTFTIADCKEVYHRLPIDVLFNDDYELRLYDIPGLNDSTTTVYTEYLTKNIMIFDVVIVVIDIHSSLNTADEMKMLDIVDLMREDANLIIVINKCEVLKDKYRHRYERNRHMMHHLSRDISDKQLPRGIGFGITALSAIDAFIYRTLAINPNAHIDIKYVDKFIINEYGATRCKKMSEEEKRQVVKNTITANCSSPQLYDEILLNCGFTSIIRCINQSLDGFVYNIYCKLLLEIDGLEVINDISKCKILGIDNYNWLDAKYNHLLCCIEDMVNLSNKYPVFDFKQYASIINKKIEDKGYYCIIGYFSNDGGVSIDNKGNEFGSFYSSRRFGKYLNDFNMITLRGINNVDENDMKILQHYVNIFDNLRHITDHLESTPAWLKEVFVKILRIKSYCKVSALVNMKYRQINELVTADNAKLPNYDEVLAMIQTEIMSLIDCGVYKKEELFDRFTMYNRSIVINKMPVSEIIRQIQYTCNTLPPAELMNLIQNNRDSTQYIELDILFDELCNSS